MVSQPVNEVSDSELLPRNDEEVSGDSRVVPLDRDPRSSPPTRKSTGPRTSAGKERSKHNATKHGIFSNVALLSNESRSEFDSLLSGLQNDFKPDGTLENVLVEKLASLFWRSRRLIVAETADIQKAITFLESDETERQNKAAHEVYRRFHETNCLTNNAGLIQRIDLPRIVERCVELLQELKSDIQMDGFDPASDQVILTKVYGNGQHLASTLVETYKIWSRTAQCSNQDRKKSGCSSPEECKEIFLAALEEQLQHLRRCKEASASVSSERMRLEALRQNVPDSHQLDRLLRYEASLERSIDRTLVQLERIQRMRLGQPVSSPIKVSVSS